jgi:hypothetical protein
MINCPRCEQPVDETVRTTCPLCFTPLRPEAEAAPAQSGAAPLAGASSSAYGATPLAAAPPQQPVARPLAGAPVQPTAMPLNGSASPSAMPLNAPPAQPLRNANTMRTLNGDIIEAPPAPAAPSPMGGNYAPRPAAPRPGYSTPARVETKAKSGGGGIAVVLVALLLLGSGGFGGYFWWTHRAGDPKDTVKRALADQANGDYKDLYGLIDLSDQMKAQVPDAQAFADKQNAGMAALENGPIGALLKATGTDLKATMKKMTETAKIGETKVEGDVATVPVTMQIPSTTQTMTINAHLKQVGGAWKIEPDSAAQGFSGLGSGGGLGSFGGR